MKIIKKKQVVKNKAVPASWLKVTRNHQTHSVTHFLLAVQTGFSLQLKQWATGAGKRTQPGQQLGCQAVPLPPRF